MQKCVLISNDSRSYTQIRGWLKLFENRPYMQICTSQDAFESAYSSPLKKRDLLIDEGAEAAGDIESDDTSQMQKLELEAELTPIRLLIIDLDTIKARPLDWLVATIDKLTSLGHISEATGFRTLLLGYDDPNIRPDRFRHEAVDDMVLKPLDQQLFLQKLELLLAEKPDVTPSFLFRARTDTTIEIGKDATVDEVSDFAISIRNPAPLADGVFAVIHSSLLGSSANASRIIGRSYAAVKHPQIEGLWLVRFAFFGITSVQLAEVRKFIRARQMPSRVRSNRSTKDKGAEKLPPRSRVAVIDLDPDFLNEVQSCIEDQFDRTAAVPFSSYTRFVSELAKLSGQVDANAEPVSDEDAEQSAAGAIPGGRTTLRITEGSYELLDFEPQLKPKELFLGRAAEDWKSRPQDWFYAVPKSDLEDFNEFLNYTETGGRGVTGVRFRDKDGLIVYAEVKGRLVPSSVPETPAVIYLELKQIDRSAWKDLNRLVSKGATPDQFRFDAIVVDAGLLRTEAAEWLDGLHSVMVRARVIVASEPLPKIFILADEESKILPSSFMHKGISDFIYKPFDRRLFTEKFSVGVPQLTRSTFPDNPPFVPCELTAQICKTIKLEALSEFGLTVTLPAPFKLKTFMRFFSPLFGNIVEGVLARCTASLPANDEDESYRCQFVFFGCSDELHKRIRNWIREDYVQKKELR